MFQLNKVPPLRPDANPGSNLVVELAPLDRMAPRSLCLLSSLALSLISASLSSFSFMDLASDRESPTAKKSARLVFSSLVMVVGSLRSVVFSVDAIKFNGA